jgi:tight adherence protein C
MPDLAHFLEAIVGAGFGLRVGTIAFDPLETILLVVALVTALLSAIELWRLSRREVVQSRFEGLRAAPTSSESLTQAAQSRWYERLGGTIAASSVVGPTEQAKMIGALAAAGIKGPGRLATFVAIKIALLAGTPLLVWGLIEWDELFVDQTVMRLGWTLAGVLLGWRLPDIVVSRLAKRRKVQLELGMPDALDLLVICAEAGLGIEQSIEQVAKDLRISNPFVAEEFSVTAAEMRILSDRRVALENLAQRTGITMLKSLVSTLNQSMRYGTSLADAVRVLAAEMRTLRITRFEERAARLPVILTLPLLLFVMPALFAIIGGPAALNVIDAFSK